MYQLCMPYHEDVKSEFIQKYVFLYTTSYISVCYKTVLRLYIKQKMSNCIYLNISQNT